MKNSIRQRLWRIFFMIALLACALAFSRGASELSAEKDYGSQQEPRHFHTLALQDTADVENLSFVKEAASHTTVRLNFVGQDKNWYGTAILWEQTKEELITATSAHLLLEAGEKLFVTLPEKMGSRIPGDEAVKNEAAENEVDLHGSKAAGIAPAEAQILGISGCCDVGFVSIKKADIPEDILKQLRIVRLHQRTYDTLTAQDRCFTVGSDAQSANGLYEELVFLEEACIEEGGAENLLLFSGKAVSGMSGGGVFDGYGHLIGLLSGMTGDETVAAVPMPDINRAWRQLNGQGRDTKDYGS